MSKKASHIINLSSFILEISYAIARLNSEALFHYFKRENAKVAHIHAIQTLCIHKKKICLATKLKWILIRTIRH